MYQQLVRMIKSGALAMNGQSSLNLHCGRATRSTDRRASLALSRRIPHARIRGRSLRDPWEAAARRDGQSSAGTSTLRLRLKWATRVLTRFPRSVRQTQNIVSPFNKVQNHLLETLYQTDFQVVRRPPFVSLHHRRERRRLTLFDSIFHATHPVHSAKAD